MTSGNVPETTSFEDDAMDALFDALEESQRARGVIPVHNADDIDAAMAALLTKFEIRERR